MTIKTEQDIIQLIQNDPVDDGFIEMAKSLGLPDWWICAGFVRSKIWDVLHGFEVRMATPDIDVIYYDSLNIDEAAKIYKTRIEESGRYYPLVSKKSNQHAYCEWNSTLSSSVDAISKFPETATALGVKLDERNNVILTAPCGIEDVLSLQVKPTPHFLETKDEYICTTNRVNQKNWQSKWPNITITYPEILKRVLLIIRSTPSFFISKNE